MGGRIGGQKVKKMIEMAKDHMAENSAQEMNAAKNEGRTEHPV